MNKNVTDFDSFDNILYIFQKKSRNLFITKTSQQIFFRIQAYNSATCGYFCIGFIDFMLKDKSLKDFINLFPPNSFQKMMIQF